MPIKSEVFKVDTKFFHIIQRIKIRLPCCEIAKNKVAKITHTNFGDKSQKFAPAEKKQLYGNRNSYQQHKKKVKLI